MIRLKNAAFAPPAPACGEKMRRPARQSAAAEDAEEAAVAALGFIAANEKLLERFLSVSGLTPQNLRAAAAEPGFLAGALNFLLSHEPDLLEFCAQTQRKPENIARAYDALPGGRGAGLAGAPGF